MTAYWLAKGGADVTIIERFPALRTGGQNIDIRTCGVTVVRKIAEMESALRANAAPLEGKENERRA
jgi:2-polyprenyl-6-methoxyphenol hydroxylase-like FAD-dependent oxidoreductase